MKNLLVIILLFLSSLTFTPVFASTSQPIYSEKGDVFAYSTDATDGKLKVVYAGQDGKAYDDITFLSFRGNDLVYVAKEGNKQFIVLGGVEKEKYDSIFDFRIIGRSIAYIGVLNNQYYAIADQYKMGPYDSLSFDYTTREGKITFFASSKGKSFFIINGKETKRYDEVSSLIFFKDNKTVFIAKEKNKYFLVINSKEGKRYDYLYTSNYDEGAGSKSFIGSATLKDTNGVEHKKIIKIDNESKELYDEIISIVRANDSFTYYLIVKKNNKYYVLANNKLSKPYDTIINSNVNIGPKNNYSYFAQRNKKWYLILNNNEIKEVK